MAHEEDGRRQQRVLHPGARPRAASPGSRDRSPRRRPPGEGAGALALAPPGFEHEEGNVPAEDQTIRDYIEKNFTSPTPESKVLIRRASLSLLASIEALQRVVERRETYKAQIRSLEENVIPVGVRPFTVSYESPFLDINQTGADFEFHIDLSNRSIREAKQTAYIQHLLIQKRLDVMALDAQRKDLKAKASRSTFVDKCCAVEQSRKSPFEFLHLDDDPDLNLDADRLLPQLAGLYKKIVDQAAARKQSKIDKNQREEAKQQRIADSVSAKSPDELLTMVIDSRIAESKKKATDKKQPRASSSAPGGSSGISVPACTFGRLKTL